MKEKSKVLSKFASHSLKGFLEKLLDLSEVIEGQCLDSTTLIEEGVDCDNYANLGIGEIVAGQFSVEDLSTLAGNQVHFYIITDTGKARFNLTKAAAADFFAAGIF